ncbi:MAG: tRNA (guanosine(37)-N1)-methyltransferase TrmD [Oscillospiraceae bacterium]
MRIDIATLFVEMCESVLNESIIGRARKKGLIEFHCHNIREFSTQKHRHVDDIPYGGGKGMVMQAEPIYACYSHICEEIGKKPYVIYLSPQGNLLTQKKCVNLAKMDNIMLLCGHYEGVDERILEEIVDEEISIGDYVLTGGELPALVLCDSVARMCENVLSSPECYMEESHYNGLLEYPQYTRPNVWHEKIVPDVLLSGHHKNISNWRQKNRLERTKTKRPDMYIKYELTIEDEKLLK